MNYMDALTEIPQILKKLDEDIYPEIYDLLDRVAARQALDEDSDLAYYVHEIMIRDIESGDLPDYVLDYVKRILASEIEKENAEAMNDMGAYYYDGARGFGQDFTKSVEYYTMAANNGSRQAQENLGYCYYYGRNVDIDYEKAFNYFALGAFDGHVNSLYKIADMYANGYYVQKNEKEAFHLYSYCADQLSDENKDYFAGPVFLRLGKAFLYGRGTDVDAMEALKYFQKAERYLYKMVSRGDVMYRKSLMGAIDGQKEAREILMKELPEKQWLDGKRD